MIKQINISFTVKQILRCLCFNLERYHVDIWIYQRETMLDHPDCLLWWINWMNKQRLMEPDRLIQGRALDIVYLDDFQWSLPASPILWLCACSWSLVSMQCLWLQCERDSPSHCSGRQRSSVTIAEAEKNTQQNQIWCFGRHPAARNIEF